MITHSYGVSTLLVTSQTTLKPEATKLYVPDYHADAPPVF